MILNKPNTRKINILGTEWTIICEKDCDGEGFTDNSVKEIHISVRDKEQDDLIDIMQPRKTTVRHEIIHAFLCESGLYQNSSDCDAWAINEEMVDWFALQFHKIAKVFKELKILGLIFTVLFL